MEISVWMIQMESAETWDCRPVSVGNSDRWNLGYLGSDRWPSWPRAWCSATCSWKSCMRCRAAAAP